MDLVRLSNTGSLFDFYTVFIGDVNQFKVMEPLRYEKVTLENDIRFLLEDKSRRMFVSLLRRPNAIVDIKATSGYLFIELPMVYREEEVQILMKICNYYHRVILKDNYLFHPEGKNGKWVLRRIKTEEIPGEIE